MEPQQTTSKAGSAGRGKEPAQGTCQVCGKVGRVVAEPEKPPPNVLCYRCVVEYGMQDAPDDD